METLKRFWTSNNQPKYLTTVNTNNPFVANDSFVNVSVTKKHIIEALESVNFELNVDKLKKAELVEIAKNQNLIFSN